MLVSLEQACAESLLSENASRLTAMQVAERNISDYLDDLRHKLNGQRQSEITSELLDIVAGSEALFGEEAPEEYGLSYAE
ncbi:MAG: F0F1 ATP synthase subunit gamma [Thermoleophilia bacterium]